jgi:alkaline phosphatase D
MERTAASVERAESTSDKFSQSIAMNPISRRRFLSATAAAIGAGLAYPRATGASTIDWTERRDLYPQGVASGDPTPDSVILWTRRPPTSSSRTRRLSVELASDPDFTRVVAQGRTSVSEETDWTCRFLAVGLLPAHEYWYRFTDEHGFGTRVGRTLTAPAPDDDRAVRFAFVSCQSVTEGACNAYRRMIYEDERRAPEERLFFVLHLGDFIYEVVWYADEKPTRYARRIRDVYRLPQGEKIGDLHVPVSLEDYRTTYRAYLQDPDLQDARARWPFVCVWDNHEFSWQGWQSQQVFDGKTRPAQTKKVFANQAWFEYQPARVRMPRKQSLDAFEAPRVKDERIDRFDDLGLGLEPNNLAAVNSLKVYRALRWGRNVDLIITDNHSYRAEPPNMDAFGQKEFRWALPQEAIEIFDNGRQHNGGRPPDAVRFGDRDIPNDRKSSPPQSFLGHEQKQWLIERLKSSAATWKIWGHSFGTLEWRTDFQNLPAGNDPKWRGGTYGMFSGAFFVERGEILDLIRDQRITNFAIVAGDRHSFWAGTLSKGLPPQKFEPLGVEFITGSISAPGIFEAAEYSIPRTDPLRALYLHDRPNGEVWPAVNMSALHGVRASLTLAETGDVARALAASNPDVAPHLSFVDLGGHGYATVRAGASELETEFVCIPRPIEHSDRPDGGPLAYRAVHRVKTWKAGERPQLVQKIVEGTPLLATKEAL